MNKLPYSLLQEDSSPLNQQRAGLLSTITAVGGAQVRNYSDVIGLAQTGNIEVGVSYNCGINLASNVWNGRDVTDVCWLEKWTDVGGVKEVWYAPTGAAGAAPVWQKVDSLDLVNALRTFTGSFTVSGTVGMAAATASGHGVNLGQFPSSVGANGYQKLPGGLIIQWGSTTNSATVNTATAVTFPVAFPTACRIVTNTATGTSSQSASAASFTTTGFSSYAGSASLVTNWVAIGN